MSSRSGVKFISILTVVVYILYLVALGLYGFLHGLHVETTVAEVNDNNETQSINDENANPDEETGISDAAILYCIHGMSTYYMGMVISDSDIFIKAIISLIVCIIGITLNVMLLFGSEGKRRFLILPWLIMTMFHLVVSSEAHFLTETYISILKTSL